MKEPDDTPLRREHIVTFLQWYGSRVPVPTFPGVEQMWWNALHQLTLGQLRTGMRTYSRFTSKLALNPPQFWGLCQGTASELTIQRLNELRDNIKKGKMKIAPAYKPRKAGTEDLKPGASHD
jgi:hypothetical protein